MQAYHGARFDHALLVGEINVTLVLLPRIDPAVSYG